MGTANALLDAVALARALAGAPLADSAAVAAALRAYEEERRAVLTPMFHRARAAASPQHDDNHADNLKVACEAALRARRPASGGPAADSGSGSPG